MDGWQAIDNLELNVKDAISEWESRLKSLTPGSAEEAYANGRIHSLQAIIGFFDCEPGNAAPKLTPDGPV